jgi:hypothetical protein
MVFSYMVIGWFFFFLAKPVCYFYVTLDYQIIICWFYCYLLETIRYLKMYEILYFTMCFWNSNVQYLDNHCNLNVINFKLLFNIQKIVLFW